MLFRYCWIKLLVLEIVQSSNRVSSVDFPYQDHLVCHEYLVSGTKYNVSDEQLNASSQFSDLHAAKWGRLNTVYVKGKHIGGWAAGDKKPPHYIEVRLDELSIIQAIATQGRNITGESAQKEQYVTNYHVYYKTDDARRWDAVRGGPGYEPKVFQGNNDSNSIRINKLPCAVQANDVRILVTASHNNNSMRFDVIGCPVSQVNLSPDCDFEDGFCGWKEEHDNDSAIWEIKSGTTSAKPLNVHDHTCKNETGLFAYMKSISSPDGSRRNKSAQLVTMIRRSNITRCLHLWHSGSDSSFSLLTLSVIGCENASERCISKQVRDLTQEWNHISLDVGLNDYKFIVEGTVTSEDDSYLAIDDISLTKGFCPDCTFEDGFCNWKNPNNIWTRRDHDSQRYIVITGESKNASTRAKLHGPEVDTGYNSSCLSFSYIMSGDESNALSVSLLMNKTALSLGNLNGKDYDGWRKAFYEIVNNGEKYTIQFLAVVTNGYVGLDNISLIFEPCPVITTLTAAPSILSTIPDSIRTAGTWTDQDGKLSNVSHGMMSTMTRSFSGMVGNTNWWNMSSKATPAQDIYTTADKTNYVNSIMSPTVIPTTITAPSLFSTAPDSITTLGTWTSQVGKSSNEGEKDKILVGVAVGVGVLSLAVLTTIGIYVTRQRRLKSSAATNSKHTDNKMALNVENQPVSEGNAVSIDTGQEYTNVMSGKSESVSPDHTYGNNQGVQSKHQTRLIKEDCEYAVVSKPKRKITQETQEEQTYDHLDMGEKVLNLDDETYDHVKK